jgi:hypothetical protein
MAITRESAREMSGQALVYTLNDLNEVIECQEPMAKEFGMNATPKLGQYYDERFAVLEAIVARRECPH